ncbi:MAG TPA: hypothetical protein VKV27_00310 [Solirubrobacteraceae bacterium]|nr:hypothetical protein [Solirubrobacteraceae bacterium]
MRTGRAGRWGARFAAIAAAVLMAGAAAAVAGSFTLGVARVRLQGPSGRRVERIAVNSRGVAVYELVGETAAHPLCTAANGCFSFWPPVRVSARGRLTHAPGIRGRLGRLRRDGIVQLTLNGHPLYTFAPDRGRRGIATGDGIHSFGGVWRVLPES